jgi:hypothetical protein
MLKAVDNPSASGELGQGVMVTPEGGYVVAKPDLWVNSAWFLCTFTDKYRFPGYHGRNRLQSLKASQQWMYAKESLLTHFWLAR